MGTVRDIVWNGGQDPTKEMPVATMVEADDYKGPKFPARTTFSSSLSLGDLDAKNVIVRALSILLQHIGHKD